VVVEAEEVGAAWARSGHKQAWGVGLVQGRDCLREARCYEQCIGVNDVRVDRGY